MLLYVTLALCALLAGLLVYRYDMYDREPWYMMVTAIVVGAAAMWGTGHLENRSISFLQDVESVWSVVPLHVSLSLVAATHEELARLLVVIGFAVLARRHFNDPLDGIIYGSVVGLGMAVQESLQYLSDWKATGPLPATEVLRLLGHLVMGGITGFGIGMLRMRIPRAVRTLLGCLIVSTALHFFWDWISFSARESPVMPWLQKLSAMFLVLWGCLFYGVLVITGSRWSRKVFSPGRRASLWGWPFTLWKLDPKEESTSSSPREAEPESTLEL